MIHVDSIFKMWKLSWLINRSKEIQTSVGDFMLSETEIIQMMASGRLFEGYFLQYNPIEACSI